VTGEGQQRARLGAIGGPYAVLVGIFLLTLFVSAVQIMPASVLPLVMADQGVSPSLASSLVSLSLLSPAILARPVGFSLDRLDNRLVLFGGTLLVLISGIWSWDSAARGAFTELMISRLLMGTGLAMTWTSGANIVAAAFTNRNAATATGIYTASAPLGYAVGQAVPPLVAGYFDWRLNFLLLSGAAALSYALFAVFGYRTAAIAETERTAGLADFRHVLTRKAVWIVALMSFAGYSLILFFNSWMPTYLATELGVGLAESGIMVALFPAMGVLARPTGGLISDRFLSGRRRPVPLLSFVVTAAMVVAVTATRTPILLAGLMVLSGYFAQLGIGIFYTYIRELVDEHVAGSAIAVLSMASFSGGFSAPLVAGWLIERTGAYLSAFVFALAIGLFGVTLAWFAPEPDRRATPASG